MAIESTEQKGSNIFNWVIKKGKKLFEKALMGNIEPEPMSAPIKKSVVLTPKSTEPVKWPLPTKK